MLSLVLPSSMLVLVSKLKQLGLTLACECGLEESFEETL